MHLVYDAYCVLDIVDTKKLTGAQPHRARSATSLSDFNALEKRLVQEAYERAEWYYRALIRAGTKPKFARLVLPMGTCYEQPVLPRRRNDWFKRALQACSIPDTGPADQDDQAFQGEGI